MIERAAQRPLRLREQPGVPGMPGRHPQILAQKLRPVLRRIVHVPLLLRLAVSAKKHHQELVLVPNAVRLGAAPLGEYNRLLVLVQLVQTSKNDRLRFPIGEILDLRAQLVVPHHRAVLAARHAGGRLVQALRRALVEAGERLGDGADRVRDDARALALEYVPNVRLRLRGRGDRRRRRVFLADEPEVLRVGDSVHATGDVAVLLVQQDLFPVRRDETQVRAADLRKKYSIGN